MESRSIHTHEYEEQQRPFSPCSEGGAELGLEFFPMVPADMTINRLPSCQRACKSTYHALYVTRTVVHMLISHDSANDSGAMLSSRGVFAALPKMSNARSSIECFSTTTQAANVTAYQR